MPAQTKEPIDFERVQSLQKAMFEDMTLMFNALNQIAAMSFEKGVDMQIVAQRALERLDNSLKGVPRNA